MLFYSVLLGLIAGLAWLLGDILLVGFPGDIQDDIALFEGRGVKDPKVAAYMVRGRERRLRWGALIGNFSAPLLFCSLYSTKHLLALDQGLLPLKLACLILMGLGFVFSPLAHASFYYIGTFGRLCYLKRQRGDALSDDDVVLLNAYQKMTFLAWVPAVGLTALGWFLFVILILLQKTSLPLYFAFLTPFTLAPLTSYLVKRLKLFHPWLRGAGLNLGLSLYYLILMIHIL